MVVMMKQEEQKWTKFFAKAFKEVMLPALDDLKEEMDKRLLKIEENMATKADIDRLERKFNAGQDRLDMHDKRITKLEGRVFKN